MRTEQAGAGRLPNMTLIGDRPPEVDDSAVLGHWEDSLHRQAWSVGDRGARHRRPWRPESAGL